RHVELRLQCAVIVGGASCGSIPGRRATISDMLSSRPVVMTTRLARDAGARVVEPRRLAVLVLAACALALPFFLWDFRTYQLAFAATNAIAILGLNPDRPD